MPCEWNECGQEALAQAPTMYDTKEEGVKVDDDGVPVTNARMRKALYRIFTYGKRNRIPIPTCVMEKIREVYSETDGNYMGFEEE